MERGHLMAKHFSI